MKFVKDWILATMLLWSRWWMGEYVVTLEPTGNDLAEKYTSHGTTYHFECIEYIYTLKSPSWWRRTQRFYMYKVNMFDGDNHTEGLYPRLTSWHVNHTRHSHHLAVRAHIQLNVVP